MDLHCINCLLVILITLAIIFLAKAANRPVPKVIMMRRVIENYSPGNMATVTIVYRTEQKFKVRWFRYIKNFNSRNSEKLPNAEIENMLIVTGNNDGYELSGLRSGTIHTTTLTVKVVPQRFSTEYKTVFDAQDVPMQYTLDTDIRHTTDMLTEYLDGIHWLRVPPPSMYYNYRSRFNVRCMAVVEGNKPDDSLRLYRNRVNETHGGLVNTPFGIVSKTNDKYDNRDQKFIYKGKRIRRTGRKFRFEISVGINTANKTDGGMFACAMARQNDRAFISTWVKQGLLRAKPKVEVIPCGRNNTRRSQVTVLMSHDKENCFKCRGFGYPLPEIQLEKSNRPYNPDHSVYVDSHVNVMDGGLSEVTYTFFKPRQNRHRGTYRCTAKNAEGESAVEFSLQIEK